MSVIPRCYTLRQVALGNCVPFLRSIGKWTLTALVINSIIGSGIFGLPSELTRLLGRASPLAMLVAAFAMATMILCMAEVASQFSEAGGPYLYTRAALGRFSSIQIGWFHLLAGIRGGAASAALLISYLTALMPWVGRGPNRALLLFILIAIPTAANYVGVRSGAGLSTLLTVLKLLPLALIISLGVFRFSHHVQLLHASEITSPGHASWLTAILLLVFSYAGSEDALVPAGGMKEPRRTVPFALLTGLLGCVILYALLQFVTVAAIGASTTDRPLADTASVLLGRDGEMFVVIAVMMSTYGWLSGAILNLPRLACSLALGGDFPTFLGRLHARFKTPAAAIVLFSAIVWGLAATGTFLWAAALSGGATVVIYSGMCAALIRLRQRRPHADALRIPFGRTLAVIGILIALALLTQLQASAALLIGITALIATANCWWAKRREIPIAKGSDGVV
jgi:basic amino acid/polyamine antiporter, APA family